MQWKFLSGGGISQIYPPPEGAVDSRVRTDHRDHRPGGADRGTVGLVGDHKPVQHGGGDARQRNLKGELGVGRHGRRQRVVDRRRHRGPRSRDSVRRVLGGRPQPHVLQAPRGPRVGDMLNSRRVTAVYTGFENGYATATVGNDGKTTAPWWPNRNNIVAVKAIDDGIEIHSLAFCFQYMENCKSFDLAKFDMSNCTNLQHAFAYCGNATSFSISSWDTSSVVEFDSALKNLCKVKEIDISGWSTRKAGDLRLLFSTDSSLKSVKFGPGWKTSDVMDMLGMFSYCKNLNLDCSDWNVPTYANHSDFNHCAPGVILPKAWQ